MKKIRNERSMYISRSSLTQSPLKAKQQLLERKDRGDFKVDDAGYFSWPKKSKTATR